MLTLLLFQDSWEKCIFIDTFLIDFTPVYTLSIDTLRVDNFFFTHPIETLPINNFSIDGLTN